MAERFPIGVPDDRFGRADVPMTKREVRAVTLSYARVAHTDRVLDIGAGTGGLTVELARACAGGGVVAVERDPAALAVLRTNVEALTPGNVQIVEGSAPEALATLEGSFDAVVVGGHGGKLVAILDAVASLIAPGGHVVINVVGLDAMNAAREALHVAPWAGMECAQVSVSRAEPLGRDVRFVPLNPVFVIAASRAGGGDR